MMQSLVDRSLAFTVAWGWWLAAVSVIAFVVTLVLVPIIIVRLPADYLLPPRRSRRRKTTSGETAAGEVEGGEVAGGNANGAASWWQRHPATRWMLLVLKNAIGVTLLLGGFVMLFGPGQGVLSMIVGLMLLDFPGKRKLERRIIGHRRVLRAVNAIRRRWGRPPLQMDDSA